MKPRIKVQSRQYYDWYVCMNGGGRYLDLKDSYLAEACLNTVKLITKRKNQRNKTS